jgi:hypothetical protein
MSERFYLRTPGTRATFLPHPVGTPGLTRPAEITINAHGLRGRLERADDTRRILVVGASTVEDTMLNDEDTWCARLEAHLGPGTWVANAGRSACTSRHHVIQLAELLPQLPRFDLVLVLCGGGDMLAGSGAHGVERQPSLRVCFGQGPGVPPLKSPGGVHPLGEFIATWKERRQRVEADDWLHQAPDLTGHLRTYDVTLQQIAQVVQQRGNGAQLVFLTQPYLWRADLTDAETRGYLYAGGMDDPGRWARDPHTPWFDQLTLAAMLDQHNAVMRGIAANGGARCIDLAALLPQDVANYFDDLHYTAAGCDAIAGIIARELTAAAA